MYVDTSGNGPDTCPMEVPKPPDGRWREWLRVVAEVATVLGFLLALFTATGVV